MKYKIAWVGLADKGYFDHIAKYCIPSWKNLPGDKFLTTDIDILELEFFKKIDLLSIIKNPPPCRSKKIFSFWKKMRSQINALQTLTDYDFIILLDTDIEIYNFKEDQLYNTLSKIKDTNSFWGVGLKDGMSNENIIAIDSGVIIINNTHQFKSLMMEEYENYWISEKIYSLRKPYDGDVVEDMIKKHSAYFINNTPLGDGKHLYNIGFFHWGGKASKELRKSIIDVKSYIENLQLLK